MAVYGRALARFATSDLSDFWVTDKTRDALLEINKELFRCTMLIEERNGDLVSVGKEEYEEICELRDSLEHAMLEELPDLYKVKKFLKNKSVVRGYGAYNLKMRPKDNEL